MLIHHRKHKKLQIKLFKFRTKKYKTNRFYRKFVFNVRKKHYYDFYIYFDVKQSFYEFYYYIEEKKYIYISLFNIFFFISFFFSTLCLVNLLDPCVTDFF